MDVGAGRAEEDVVEGEADVDAFGKARRAGRGRLCVLVDLDAADRGDFVEYTFVAHRLPF